MTTESKGAAKGSPLSSLLTFTIVQMGALVY